jgi:DNA-binding CsgD family transcriptional regulator
MRDGATRDLGLTRGAGSRPFDENDCAWMNRLIPHVERAFAIGGALETSLAPRPAQVRNADPLLLQAEFKLTPAQARLAALLHDGVSVKQAARQLGITEGTARQYLRRIFAKTGANRQIDLIREIAWAVAEGGK